MHKNWIGGEWIGGAAMRQNINPSDITDVAACTST